MAKAPSKAEITDALVALQAADDALATVRAPLPGLAGRQNLVAGTVMALSRGDWWVPGPRELAGAVLRGPTADRVQQAGFDGIAPYKVAPIDTSPATRALHAVGMALGGALAVVHLGTGSLAHGACFEAWNLACLHKASVVFVVHDLTALLSQAGAPVPVQLACAPDALARALGLKVFKVSLAGRDDSAQVKAVREAVLKARTSASDGAPAVVLVQGAAP